MRNGGCDRDDGDVGDTNVYLSKLARRSAQVIHGTADDNGPIREPRALVPALRMFTPDVYIP